MMHEVYELLYHGTCSFVVPLCVRGEGVVAACEGLSLLGGQPLGSRVPGCKARDCLSDIRVGVVRVPSL